jgi:hypothetical protein
MNIPIKVPSIFNRVITGFKKVFSSVIAWACEEKFKPSDLFVLAVYAFIIGFGIWYHEPWSDEALPWIIARDTDWRGFLEMIWNNWDRHPGFFHVLLLPLVKLGFPYFAQSVLNALLALLAAFLFLAKAPFSRIFRYLFLFSYYMLYEYSVVVRPYMLAVALIFILAAFYPRRTRYPVTYAILTALLFHSDYMSFGLGVGLTLAYLFEYGGLFKIRPRLAAAFAVMALSGLLAGWMAHTLPVNHGQYGDKIVFHFLNGAKPLASAFFPFSDLGRHPAFTFPAAVIAGCVVLIATFTSLIRKPVPAFILGVSLVYLFTIFTCLHGGDYRNHGFILISVLFALWIAKDSAEDTGEERMSRKWPAQTALMITGLCVLLGLQNLGFVYLLEYHLPFSGCRDMARAIAKLEKEHQIFEQGFVIVSPHKNSVGLMPYLPGVRFWNPCTGDYAEYYRLTRETAACNDLPESEALVLAKRHFRDLNRVLFLFRKPLPASADHDYEYQEIYRVRYAFGHWQETFFLYRALPKASSGK